MAQLDEELDVANMDLSSSYSLLPKGWYIAQLVESDMIKTKTDGLMVKARFDILEGQYEGRPVFTNFNWRNNNPEAQEIGRKQLGQLAAAVGVGPLRDTEELHFKPVMIKVGIKVEKEGSAYDDSNRITEYKPIDAGEAGPATRQSRPAAAAPARAAAQAPPAANQAAARPAGAKPWKR